MKERPILFSAPMVRALLAGTKTQTRRMLKTEPIYDGRWAGGWKLRGKQGREAALCSPMVADLCPHGQPGDRVWQTGPIPRAGWYYVRGLLDPSIGGDERPVWVNPEHFVWGFSEQDDSEAIQLDTDITLETVQWKRCGDRLWVREAWKASSAHDALAPRDIPPGDAVEYAADPERILTGKLRPSMFMPRWASRITLEIISVRVERLQDISEADARAEGIDPWTEAIGGTVADRLTGYRLGFQRTWGQINGLGSWDANPFVWVVEFRRAQGATA